MLTLQELRSKRTELKELPLLECIGHLYSIGAYYEHVVPGKIDFAFIKETEELLNDLYLRSLNEATSTRLPGIVLEALSQAGSLSLSIRQGKLGPEFVKLSKQLGRTLIVISKRQRN